MISGWELRKLQGAVRQHIHRLYYPDQASTSVDNRELLMAMYSISAFDRNGQLLEEKWYDSENRLTSLILYSKDKAGRISVAESRTSDGSLEYRARYGYDTLGRRVTEDYYNRDDARTGGYVNVYGSDGLLARQIMDNSAGDGSSWSTEHEYVYDAQGRMVEERFYSDAVDGIMLSISHHHQDGVLRYSSHYQRGKWLDARIFYEYDSRGNLARETAFQIPELDDTDYEAFTRPQDFPGALLSSVSSHEYQYFQSEAP